MHITIIACHYSKAGIVNNQAIKNIDFPICAQAASYRCRVPRYDRMGQHCSTITRAIKTSAANFRNIILDYTMINSRLSAVANVNTSAACCSITPLNCKSYYMRKPLSSSTIERDHRSTLITIDHGLRNIAGITCNKVN